MSNGNMERKPVFVKTEDGRVEITHKGATFETIKVTVTEGQCPYCFNWHVVTNEVMALHEHLTQEEKHVEPCPGINKLPRRTRAISRQVLRMVK